MNTNNTGGDGQPQAIPDVRVNDQFNPRNVRLSVQKEMKPVSVRYTNQTPDQIVNEEFEKAEAHKISISSQEKRAYNWLKGFKTTGLLALAVGGGAAGAAWSQANRYAPDDVTHYALMLSTIMALVVGPWYASILTTHLEKGIYRGVGKAVAWAMVFIIVLDELASMMASRDPDFAAFFMVKVAPFVLPAMLMGATLQLYFRSSVKSKRDLMHMLDNERELTARNATDARTRTAKHEMRNRRLGSLAEWMSHYRTSAYNFLINLVAGLFTDAADAYRLWQVQRMKKQEVITQKEKEVKKVKARPVKKSGQGIG